MRDEEKAANLRKKQKQKKKPKKKAKPSNRSNQTKSRQTIIKHRTGSSNLKLVLSRRFPHF